MRFLGLGLEDRVPDARTIWLFREKLTTAGAIKRLFEQFDAMLRQAGYIAMSGQIVDASLVAAPRQRNTDARLPHLALVAPETCEAHGGVEFEEFACCARAIESASAKAVSAASVSLTELASSSF
jgi:hypothetical protein